jgi:hypothetical protein
MALKIIGAGLGRTGTLSLKVALEQLGFAACYHMTEVLAHPEHVRFWDAAARGEPVDWEELFRGYQATVDWPGCNFYREFLQLYPDAKVILTVRDSERWHESARQTIYYVRHAFPGWLIPFLPRMGRFQGMIDRLIWVGMFHGRFEDRSYAIAVFNRHNEEVQRLVPPDRLLVYEVKQGWGPLCQFLGVPVPEGQPFPHLNDAEEFRGRIRWGIRFLSTIALLILGTVILILVWVALRLLS